METVKIKGMSCPHCVGSVTKALETLPGITEVSVDLDSGIASFENSGVDTKTIKDAITKIGFEPLD